MVVLVAMRTGDRRAAAEPALPTVATATIKLRPPGAPAPLLPRTRLPSVLDDVPRRRLTSVVAGAGFGKSTLLAAWASDLNCAWYTASPEDVSLATFARAWPTPPAARPALPVDAASAVKAGAGRARERTTPGGPRLRGPDLRDPADRASPRPRAGARRRPRDRGVGGRDPDLEALCRQAPERLHLVVASRDDLPFPVERSEDRARFWRSPARNSRSTWTKPRCCSPTSPAARPGRGGRPAATHRRLARRRAARRGGPARRPATESPPRSSACGTRRAAACIPGRRGLRQRASRVAELVARVAPLERFTGALCDALGIPGADEPPGARPPRTLRRPPGPRSGVVRARRPVREFALARLGRRQGDAGCDHGIAVVPEPARAGGGSAGLAADATDECPAVPDPPAPPLPRRRRHRARGGRTARPQLRTSAEEQLVGEALRFAATGTTRCGASSGRPGAPTGSRPRSPGGSAYSSTSAGASTRPWRPTIAPTSRASLETSRWFSPGARPRTGFRGSRGMSRGRRARVRGRDGGG